MKHVALLIGALCLCATLGCEQKQEAVQIQPPSVGIMTIQPCDIPISNNYHAQTAGSRAVDIRAQVSGILVSRDYEEGRLVQKGDLLFKIEPDKYRAALNQAKGAMYQAQASFKQAGRDWERARKLYERNAVSQRDRDNAAAAYDTAKANLFSAKSAVEEAQINYNYAFVKSPLTGYASKERRSVGNLINANSSSESLLTVVNKVDPIHVNFSLPSPTYMQMRTLHKQGRLEMKDIKAHIKLADGSSYEHTGTVDFLDTAVNPTTSVVSARASFPNPELFVLPGQFVRVTISGIILKHSIMIPQEAILHTQQGSLVVVVDKEGKAQMRKIVLNSFSMGEWFLIDEGLQAGDRLVVDGMNRAVPNQPVSIDEAMTKRVAERYALPTTNGEATTKK